MHNIPFTRYRIRITNYRIQNKQVRGISRFDEDTIGYMPSSLARIDRRPTASAPSVP